MERRQINSHLFDMNPRRRHREVLRYITKDQRGIEVGPWFSPMASKREGFNCLSLDVFDGPTLRARAQDDASIPRERISDIEEVDLIGTSTEIGSMVASRNELGCFDYIVSSHNFEHLPNPIKFLQGCGQALKPGGLLSMAIPDRRACFDHYRPNSRLSEWVTAFFEDRSQPTLAQQFDQASLMCSSPGSRADTGVEPRLKAAFESWQSRKNLLDEPYRDTHCWTFTPTSFEILIIETLFLRVSPFEPVQVSATRGHEFFVHLRNVGYKNGAPEQEEAFYRRRQVLLDRLMREPSHPTLRKRLRQRLRSMQSQA